MGESVDVQMARLQEQLKSVITSLAEDRRDRKNRDGQINKIETNTDNLDRRLEVVEHQLAVNAPTINEFMIVKQRVIGAGKLGKWAWMLGGATITAIYTSREAIRSWFLQ